MKTSRIRCSKGPGLVSRVFSAVLLRVSRGVRCGGECWCGPQGSRSSILPWFSAFRAIDMRSSNFQDILSISLINNNCISYKLYNM